MTGDLNSFHHIFAPGAGSRTLLLLHGTGGDENSLLRFAPNLHPKASVLSVRGNVMEGGRYPRFFRRFEEGVFDEENIREECSNLKDFLVAAASRYGFDASGVDAFGFSNGANMGAAMVLLHPGSIDRAVLVRPMVPLRPALLPDLSSTHVLLLAGEGDQMSPSAHAADLGSMLQDAGCNVTYRLIQAGHELTATDLDHANLFFAQIHNSNDQT